MRCNLKELKPNPLRDFTIDPLDDETVEKLKKSIKEDGFWGGVVARKSNGSDIQVAAGWHRVKAAIKAGIDHADIYVSNDMDDAQLIRIYARENATQRGNGGTAITGTIASAVRFIAKAIMLGHVWRNHQTSVKGEQILRGQLEGEKGIGREVITEFLEGVPGINEDSVRQQLAILKSSGDYGRIITEIKNEIEHENKQALKELEKIEQERQAAEQAAIKAEQERKAAAAKAKATKEEAERKRAEVEAKRAEIEAELAEKRREEAENKAAEYDELKQTIDTARKASNSANGIEATFDFEGVTKHLTNASHIETFRKIVTSKGMKPYLALNKQAALAAELVRLAKSTDVELSSSFIKTHIGSMVHGTIKKSRTISREEKQQLLRDNWESQWREHQNDIAGHAKQIFKEVTKMAKHSKNRPMGVTLFITPSLKEGIKLVKAAIKLLESTL
jgi:ParB-like chromosome segregation protein Spo0J